MGVFSSTAESSVWRFSKIICSEIFSTPRKHLWWSLFISQVDYLKIDDKFDSFIRFFCTNLPKFIHRVTISQKNMDAKLQHLSTYLHPYGGPQVSRQKKKASGKRKTSAVKEKCSRQKKKWSRQK